MAVFQTLGELSSYFDDNGGGALDIIDAGVPLLEAGDILPRNVWKEQPSVRKVVDFIARGHAAVPRKLYRRISDTERERVTDHPIAEALKYPNLTPAMTAYRFWHSVIVDYCLYDRWCIAWVQKGGTLELHRIPARKVRFKTNALDEITAVIMYVDGVRKELDPANFILDHGYAHSGADGTSPMSTLSDLLNEQTESVNYRRDVWKRGARFSTVITRDKEWPNDKARKRFQRGLRAYSQGGANAGSLLLLEDGMTPQKIESMSSKDMNDLDGRTLSDIQVASSYHIAPELTGAREGNFSNVKAFFEALYGPALGPIITSVDQALNAVLTRGTDLYIEADIDAMLQGNFDDQLAALQSSVGAPWMSRNEARAKKNLPPIDGGDELVVPLNVLVGGQANPRDSAPKSTAGDVDVLADLVPPDLLPRSKSRAVRVKARAPETYTTKTEQVLEAFFERQKQVVLTALGAKVADEWWDQARWDKELADDLYALAVTTSTEVGTAAAESIGFDADEYDVDRTLKFLKAVAESRAGMINSTTRDRVADALDTIEDDDTPTPAEVFDEAKSARAPSAAAALVTTFSAFAVQEAGRQLAADTATKTWIVTSGNPRASHSAMDGETVGIDETFSNGMDWPGDPAGGADEVAGCTCELEMSVG